MNSPLFVPPPLYKGDRADIQHAADLQQYLQRNTRPEVLRFDAANISAPISQIGNLIRIPSTRGVVRSVRSYASGAGSGNFTIDVYNNGNSIWASAADRMVVTSVQLQEKTPTAANNILVADPYYGLLGRMYVAVTAISGTAWVGVTIDILIDPISQT